MATKRSAGKAVAATKKTVKKKAAPKAAVAGARKGTATADAPASPEKERSGQAVRTTTIGAPARDDAVSPAWSQEGDTLGDSRRQHRQQREGGTSRPGAAAGPPARTVRGRPFPERAPPARQLFPDTEDQSFEGIDLLDPTKIVPEELAPVRIIGRLTLDANPTNFFAETEQVAFCTSHVPRGIDFTDDPLLAARNFSYLDTQLSRLGGPNFDQQAIHTGVAPYFPNSLGSGSPTHVGEAGHQHVARPVSGTVVRRRPQSFDDHFTQATMFWNSMTVPERDHIVAAFSFELGKCVHPEVRAATLANLAEVDAELCGRIALNLGMDTPTGAPATDAGSSPALSQVPTGPGPIMGRTIGVLAGDGVDDAGVEVLRLALDAEGATLYVVAPTGGSVDGSGGPLAVDRTVLTTQSVEYDALVVAGGASASALATDAYTAVNLGEAFRHHKVVAAWGEGRAVLEACGISTDAAGVVIGEDADDGFAGQLIESMGWHRHWDRVPVV